jgi:hypothetical protein
MVTKSKVILNSRALDSIRPELRKTLLAQNQPFDLIQLQSQIYPNRLSQIKNENELYFFFDEDIELPTEDYIKSVRELFLSNPQLLVLGGKYVSPPTLQNYLSRCYNTQIEFWLFLENRTRSKGLIPCQNLPGGSWIISGAIKKYLDDWVEPQFWAGEDTFSIRWLQKKGIPSFYHSSADVLHYPRSDFRYFCRRAFLQGKSRYNFDLKSKRKKINWNLLWKYKLYWPGWVLHQLFVEIGSVFTATKSLIARKIPTISPVA